MPKVLCLTGMVIAILILVLFLLDLAVKFPVPTHQHCSWISPS